MKNSKLRWNIICFTQNFKRGRECDLIEDFDSPFVDSPLKESRGRSVENIEDGLLIGQRQPLVNELERERRECSKAYQEHKQW